MLTPVGLAIRPPVVLVELLGGAREPQGLAFVLTERDGNNNRLSRNNAILRIIKRSSSDSTLRPCRVRQGIVRLDEDSLAEKKSVLKCVQKRAEEDGPFGTQCYQKKQSIGISEALTSRVCGPKVGTASKGQIAGTDPLLDRECILYVNCLYGLSMCHE